MKRDGWFDPEEKEMTEPVMLGPKVFSCPGCGANWRVGPVKHGLYYDYEGKCGTCGATWVNRYYAYRKPTKSESKKLPEVDLLGDQ